MKRFRDRYEAGDLLGEFLMSEIGKLDGGIVLGLPRGGVPIAARVASRLGLPLDVFIVRKLGMPGHAEYAMGAIASGGVMVLNEDAVRRMGIDSATIEAVAEEELLELERRERLYRGGTPPLELADRDIILVDDGIATGSTMRAAIKSIRINEASSLTVAVPVAPRSAEAEIGPLVDRYFALRTPTPFSAVGWWYHDFTQTSDGEVRSLLTDP
jgi:putative phosphoribosyl transferase